MEQKWSSSVGYTYIDDSRDSDLIYYQYYNSETQPVFTPKTTPDLPIDRIICYIKDTKIDLNID